MKFLLAFLGVMASLSSSTIQAAESIDPVVQCSTFPVNATLFEACATAYYASPSPAQYPNGTVIYVGGYNYRYTIVTGLKEGTDTTKLWTIDLNKATSIGMAVNVRLEDNETCSVTVDVKGTSTKCTSCTYCGDETFTSDCTNLKLGRRATCESTRTGDVYFPLIKAALSSEPPIRFLPPPTSVQAPAKPPRAPVKAPVKSAPVKKPAPQIKAPVKPPVRTPTKQ